MKDSHRMVPNYEYIDGEDEMQYIRITDGEYQGLTYHYGKVQFNEDKESEQMAMKFTYNVVDNPSDYEYNQTLTNTLGDILVCILDEQLKEDECQE